MISLAFILGIFPSSVLLDSSSSPPSTPPTVHEDGKEMLPPADCSSRVPARGTRVYLIGDFLYWTANEDGLNFSYKAKGQSGQLPLSDVKAQEFNEEFNTGFRVGLGYRFPHDGWEAKAYVTQFRTTNHLEKEAGGSSFIQPNFGALQSFKEVHGNWHLKYTLFDVSLSRCFAASKALALSPFLGARAAWIPQTTHIKFSEPLSGNSSLHFEGKNKYTAVGLRLGTDLYFYLMKYFCLFGEASLSLLSGRFEVETKVKMNQPSVDDDLFSNENKPHRLCANGELRGGVLGTIPLYRKQAFLTFGLTYDMSMWFSQNQQINFFSSPGAIQVQPGDGDLTLQGITLSTRLDF